MDIAPLGVHSIGAPWIPEELRRGCSVLHGGAGGGREAIGRCLNVLVKNMGKFGSCDEKINH